MEFTGGGVAVVRERESFSEAFRRRFVSYWRNVYWPVIKVLAILVPIVVIGLFVAFGSGR
ncbi:MAG: hypothetical protein ABR616_14545 [Dermatophilaceae bacterium]